MGMIPTMTGLNNSGDNGAAGQNFNADQANLSLPVTQGQIDTSYGQANSGINQQQAFLNALQAQNGIGNQSQVYSQLAGVANGTGPNPALAALNQATGANVSNQAALMAGQRGAGANTGLIARQAALQGGNLQQQAAGQGATLQAQQQLNALGQMGGIAGQQVQNQAGALSGYNQAAQSEQQNLLNAAAARNSAVAQSQSSVNSANSGVASQSAGKGLMGVFGGMAQGGMVKNYDEGGDVEPEYEPSQSVQNSLDNFDAAQSKPAAGPDWATIAPRATRMFNIANQLFGGTPSNKSADPSMSSVQQQAPAPQQKSGGLGQLVSMAAAAMNKGGKVPAMVSPGERYLDPSEVQKVAEGKKSPIKAGEKIPGKAKVKGDDLKNDTVPKTLEEGGIVLPKSVTESKDAPKEAAKFVASILKKQAMSRGK